MCERIGLDRGHVLKQEHFDCRRGSALLSCDQVSSAWSWSEVLHHRRYCLLKGEKGEMRGDMLTLAVLPRRCQDDALDRRGWARVAYQTSLLAGIGRGCCH